jgi:hypothetical protein
MHLKNEALILWRESRGIGNRSTWMIQRDSGMFLGAENYPGV